MKRVKIFIKSKEAEFNLKPLDLIIKKHKVIDDYWNKRMLCIAKNDGHNLYIPMENILFYEVWEGKDEKNVL